MRVRMLGTLAIATVLLIGCQGGGGGGGRQQPPPESPEAQPGYNPANQPAVNRLGTPSPVEGGRLGRQEQGPNAGTYGNPPSEGYRGSGSAYYPPSPPVLRQQKQGASPAPRATKSPR